MKPWLTALLAIVIPLAHGQEIVTLQTRPGVTQSYFLASAPQNPQAAAVLLPGGSGNIRLRSENGKIRFGPNNFVVRTRAEYVSRGVIAAIVDAPSDQQSGMPDAFRTSEQHHTDVAAVVEDLKKRFPGVPVFLVGTSRGTVSAAALGQRMGKSVDGVVLTSSVFLPGNGKRSGQPGLSGFDFASIAAPLLFVHHVEDACNVTPYSEARRLSDRYPLVSVSGGLPPQSGPCDPLSAHGYLGKESETVEAIVNWMLKKPYAREIH